MDKLQTSTFQQKTEEFIKYFLIGLVIYASYLIYKPFILISIWAVILTVSFNSTYQKLNKLLKNKKKLSAIIFTFILLVILVLPTSLILSSISGYIHDFINNFNKDELTSLKLPKSITDLPYIGPSINEYWTNLNDNLIILMN